MVEIGNIAREVEAMRCNGTHPYRHKMEKLTRSLRQWRSPQDGEVDEKFVAVGEVGRMYTIQQS